MQYHYAPKRAGMSQQEIDRVKAWREAKNNPSPDIFDFQIFETDFSNKMWTIYLWFLLIVVISEVFVLTISSKRKIDELPVIAVWTAIFVFVIYILHVLWKKEVQKKHIYSQDPWFVMTKIFNWELLYRTLYQIALLSFVCVSIWFFAFNIDTIGKNIKGRIVG